MPKHIRLLREIASPNYPYFFNYMCKDDLNSAVNRKSLNILNYIMMRLGTDFLLALVRIMDSKHLYGDRIRELYMEICGGDCNRFIYHVKNELPCQVCGEFILGIIEPLDDLSKIDVVSHYAIRKFSKNKPNSYWSLENPPQGPNYDYPIIGPTIMEIKLSCGS